MRIFRVIPDHYPVFGIKADTFNLDEGGVATFTVNSEIIAAFNGIECVYDPDVKVEPPAK